MAHLGHKKIQGTRVGKSAKKEKKAKKHASRHDGRPA